MYSSVKHQSLLSHQITQYPDNLDNYHLLMVPESHDISKDCEWLYELLSKYPNDKWYNYIYELLKRKDYSRFLCNSYTNINCIWGIEYLKFIMKCYDMEPEKND